MQLNYWRAHSYAEQVKNAKDRAMQLIIETIHKIKIFWIGYSRNTIFTSNGVSTTCNILPLQEKKINKEVQNIDWKLEGFELSESKIWEDNLGDRTSKSWQYDGTVK